MDMELTIEGGVTVDVATKQDIDQHHRWLEERFNRRRADYRMLTGNIPAALLSNTTVALIADFGFPPAGHLYAAQWLAVFPDSPFGAAIANVTAALCIGVPSGHQGSTIYSLADVVLPGLSVPSGTNIPDSAIATAGQHLYVIASGSGLTGGTSSGYNANLGVLIAEDSPQTRAWI